jgi:O-antigen biosynthesis protein
MIDQSELPWTGERLVPGHYGDTAIEHLHRYAFACEYVGGKKVLDIACGEGYGTRLLSEVAASVIGVDISTEVVAHARRKYGEESHLTFQVGACGAIPLPDASVDAVVSFETLEHIGEHELMLREVKRVLNPSGILIMSTPDKLYCSDIPNNNNPFHIRELYEAEFRSLLGAFFSNVFMFQQKICHASVMASAAGLPINGFAHYLGDFRRLTHTNGLRSPLFNLAVATDSESTLSHNISLFEGWDLPTEIEKQASDERAIHAAARAELEKQLTAERTAYASARADLERHLADTQSCVAEAISQLEKRLGDLRVARAGEAAVAPWWQFLAKLSGCIQK